MTARLKDIRFWFIIAATMVPVVLQQLEVTPEVLAAVTSVTTMLAGWLGVRMPSPKELPPPGRA